MHTFSTSSITFSPVASVVSSPLLISSPHSGRHYPNDFLRDTKLSLSTLQHTEDRFVDWFFDDLQNTAFVTTCFPRIWCDVNRSRYELDERMFAPSSDKRLMERSLKVKAGFGVIPRLAAGGQNIYNHILCAEEIDRRINTAWLPYHMMIEKQSATIYQKFRKLLILDMHSMPPIPLSKQYDVILGNLNGVSCCEHIISFVEAFFKEKGYSVARNILYCGGYITQKYGTPAQDKHALQVEINRKIYLNLSNLKLSSNAQRVKHDLLIMINRLENFLINP